MLNMANATYATQKLLTTVWSMTKQTTPSLKGSKVLLLQQLGPVRTAQCTQVFLILGTPAAAQEGQGCDYGVKALAVDYLI